MFLAVIDDDPANRAMKILGIGDTYEDAVIDAACCVGGKFFCSIEKKWKKTPAREHAEKYLKYVTKEEAIEMGFFTQEEFYRLTFSPQNRRYYVPSIKKTVTNRRKCKSA